MPKNTDSAKTLKLTQIKSAISCPADQGATLRALGLKRIRHSVEQVDNPAVRGMIFKVKHLLTVEEL
jgi:large subunit ribosomal protein L30